jgi:hypothetical protein
VEVVEVVVVVVVLFPPGWQQQQLAYLVHHLVGPQQHYCRQHLEAWALASHIPHPLQGSSTGSTHSSSSSSVQQAHSHSAPR